MNTIIRKTSLLLICIGLFTGTISAATAVISEPIKSTSSVPVVPVEEPKNASTIKDALKEFKSLSRKEKKMRFKEVKKELKEFKKQKKAGNDPSGSKLLQIIFAIILPPVGVLLHEGGINNKFWICLLLTLLFFLPGMIYALIVVTNND